MVLTIKSCIQWFKDTNLKANHNAVLGSSPDLNAVFNGSKILIWKQITTGGGGYIPMPSCIQWFKDTNLKANHNAPRLRTVQGLAVFNGSKILIWKQITTVLIKHLNRVSCIQWFKDTNLKANHNAVPCNLIWRSAVFNGSKILIWKQITTKYRYKI